MPHIVHQCKVSLTCVACVERGKREGAISLPPPPCPCPFWACHARLNSVAEHKENVGRAEWTPRLGESGLGILKYVVCSHLQMVRLSSVVGQGWKTAVPFKWGLFRKTFARNSCSNFCRVFAVFLQTSRRPCAHWSMDRKKERYPSINSSFMQILTENNRKKPCHVARFRHKPAFHYVSSLRR